MAEKHGTVSVDNLDREKFTADIEIVKKDKEYLLEISNKICGEFTSHLDKLMEKIYRDVIKDQIDDKTLERYFLELTNLIYFCGDKLEALGIEQVVASARNQEIFNRIYQEAEGTIKDKQSQAEEGSKYEYFLKAVYDSVYKRIKMKMDAAENMVSTLKRVQMARVAEKNLSNMSSRSVKAAFEGDE